jgi:hypothetical protein
LAQLVGEITVTEWPKEVKKWYMARELPMASASGF